MQYNSPYELKYFQELISSDEDLHHCCPKDNDFLMKFLRAKDLNVGSAMVTLKKYIKMRQKIKNYNPESVRYVLESEIISILKNRDPHARLVGIGVPGHWNIEKVSSEQIFRLTALSLEQTIQTIETQEKGIVIVMDASGFTVSHCLQLGFRQISKFITILQGGFPVRVKQFHVVNQPQAFTILYSIAYPLVTEKMRKRLFIHGKDLNSLHNHLPREILPDFLGGNLPNDFATDKNFFKELLLRDEYFKMTSNQICKC